MAGSPNFVAKIVEQVKRSVVNRVIAFVAVLLIGGASYAIKMVTGGSQAQNAPAVAKSESVPMPSPA